MPKAERKQTTAAATQQMTDIKESLGGTTRDLQTQAQPAREQATQSFGAAQGAASGLATGAANPYATNLAVTGGISEDEAQKMETTATRGVSSVYDVLGAEAKRKAAITGGYGGSGEIAQMARQAGQKQAEALTTSQANIAGIRQRGREAGAGMVSQQQIAGAQMLTQQYGLSAEQAQAVMDQIIKAQATGAQLTQGDIDLLAQMSKQPGGFMTGLSAVGSLASAAGSVMTGLGGLGVGGARPSGATGV